MTVAQTLSARESVSINAERNLHMSVHYRAGDRAGQTVMGKPANLRANEDPPWWHRTLAAGPA